MIHKRRSKSEIAQKVAQDLAGGMYVNLGIGFPTSVADYIDRGSGVVLHSENGILGMGPTPTEGAEDYDLVNAGKLPVTLLPGASFFHHADSFAMMRGGHLDVCVLGAYQVSFEGDLANWSTGEPRAIPAVGGAMDLATGAKQTWVMMDLFDKQGRPKLVPKCTYPLTACRCVKRVYSDIGTITFASDGVRLTDMVYEGDRASIESALGVAFI